MINDRLWCSVNSVGFVGYERLEETLAALGGQVQRASGIIPFSEPTGTFETSVYPSV